MNREQAKDCLQKLRDLIPVVEHYANGGEVQFFGPISKEWLDDASPNFNHDNEWRKKPEPIERWVILSDTGIESGITYLTKDLADKACAIENKNTYVSGSTFKPVLMRQVEE